MRGPDFVDRDFAGVFVDTDFGNLCGVRVRGRRADARALVLAAAGFGRRRVGSRASQRAMKVDCGHDRLLESHRVFRTFILALLLQRPTQDLPLDPPRDRSLVLLLCGTGAPARVLPLNYFVAAKNQLFRATAHPLSRSRRDLPLHLASRAQRSIPVHKRNSARCRPQ